MKLQTYIQFEQVRFTCNIDTVDGVPVCSQCGKKIPEVREKDSCDIAFDGLDPVFLCDSCYRAAISSGRFNRICDICRLQSAHPCSDCSYDYK